MVDLVHLEPPLPPGAYQVGLHPGVVNQVDLLPEVHLWLLIVPGPETILKLKCVRDEVFRNKDPMNVITRSVRFKLYNTEINCIARIPSADLTLTVYRDRDCPQIIIIK